MTVNQIPVRSTLRWCRTGLLGLAVALVSGLSHAADIDTCKDLIVAPMADDTFTLERVVLDQGRKHGFAIRREDNLLPEEEALSACTLVASWLGSLEQGDLLLRVLDTTTGLPLGRAEVRASNKLGFEPMLRSAADKAFVQLGYRGFDAAAHQARLARLYPARPAYQIVPAWLATWQPQHPVEGVWVEPDGAYRLAIVPAPKGFSGTHIAVVLASRSPLWAQGEIKATLTVEAPGAPVLGTFYLLNKRPVPAVLTRRGDALAVTIRTPAGTTDITFQREGGPRP